MPTPPAFPNLRGQGWSIIKRPIFSTRIAAHISGREVRAPFFKRGLYEFELTIEGLDANGTFPSLGSHSLQALMGLYLQCQGSFGTFLYTDTTDSSAVNQLLGIGTGLQTDYTLQRPIGGSIEPVSYATKVSNVTLDGSNQIDNWRLVEPNSIVFDSAPANGTVVAATFEYAYECRFVDDRLDFENFMKGLWKIEKVRFRSVKT